MKTLLVSEIFPPNTGGSGRWFYEIYRRLPREAFTIAAGETPGQAAFDRATALNVLRLPLASPQWGLASPRGLAGYWRNLKAVRRLVRDQEIERLHCGRCLPEGWIGVLLKHVARIPYLCYVHGEDVATASESRELSWMVRRVLRGADLLIANSHNTARLLREDWRLPATKVRVLHPGVDTGRFTPAARDAAVRRRLGWDDRPVVLTVGRLQKRKGQDMMIRGLTFLRDAVPDVLYAIVGEGEERASLEKLARVAGVGRHVQFLGEVDDATMIACYQQCDLFVLPNRQVGRDIEGFGMVLLEAQACGMPVVAGDSGGTAETMQVPRTGRIVDCRAPDDLALLTAGLLLDAPLRQEMGRAGRQWTVEHFDWGALARQAADVFGCGLEGERAERRGVEGGRRPSTLHCTANG